MYASSNNEAKLALNNGMISAPVSIILLYMFPFQ